MANSFDVYVVKNCQAKKMHIFWRDIFYDGTTFLMQCTAVPFKENYGNQLLSNL